jgi:hypothetical protein
MVRGAGHRPPARTVLIARGTPVKLLALLVVGMAGLVWAGGESGGPPAVVAEVDGRIITAQALEAKVSPSLARLEVVVYRLKRDHLDSLVDEVLLQQEAERRGISKEALVAEVTELPRIPVSEAEAEEFYQDNAELFPAGKEAAREEIHRLVREKKAAEKLREVARPLREKAQIVIFLSPPSSPPGHRPPSQAQSEPPKQSMPAPPSAPPGAVAEVNGVAIMARALEEGLQRQLSSFETLRYKMQQTTLDEMIAEVLVEEEAKKRGLSKEELFESVTRASTLTIPADQVEAVYQRIRNRQPQEDEHRLKEKITQRLRHRRALPAWKAFIESLRAGATINTYLKAPTAQAVSPQG